jgi:lipopolysaccharide/colanic/teichoic acid biosynthesis glycosyltransferase
VSVPARVLRRAKPGAYDVPVRVQEIAGIVDWDAALPERAHTAAWRLQQGVKRVLDVALAGAGLVLLSPVFVVIAMLVKLSSPGPVFYEWRVLGRNARPFIGYKFRTMVDGADALKARFRESNHMTGPVFKIRDDPRVTPIGRWLRRYSIDELPQLWSVLKGDMSLVGPRPPGPHEYVEFEPWQWTKLAVTPGITCLWQVGGRSDIPDFEQWMRLDLQYIRDWNLMLDLKILVQTVPAVLSGRGAY